MKDAQGRYQVRFTKQALEDWGVTWPDMPPGDEVVLWMRPAPCSVCGQQIDGIGASDPQGISDDGELLGEQVCEDCIKDGH